MAARKAARTSTPEPGTSSQTGSTADQSEEQTPLLSLPEDVLVLLLSYLPSPDLVTAGRAYPRLAELIRAHRSLWCRKLFDTPLYFSDVEEMAELMRVVAPTVDRVFFNNSCQCCCDDYGSVPYRHEPEPHGAEYSARRGSSGSCSFLEDRGGGAETTCEVESDHQPSGSTIIEALPPTLKSLKILRYWMRMDELSHSLRNARCLETLSVNVRNLFRKWPQNSVLPNLRTVKFDTRAPQFFFSELEPEEEEPGVFRGTFSAIGSLLRAHSGQLRSVTLKTEDLGPVLLGPWPSDLDQLSIVATAAAVDKCLRRMNTLKELRVTMGGTTYKMDGSIDFDGDDGDFEGDSLSYFRHFNLERRLGLKRLELFKCEKATVVYLLARGLHDLEALVVVVEGEMGSSTTELFRNISPAAIPALNLLIVSSTDYYCERATGVELDPVLQDLVRRAPSRSLHVVVRRRPVPESKAVWLIMFGHSPEEDESKCPLCADAVDTLRRVANRFEDLKFERVQVP